MPRLFTSLCVCLLTGLLADTGSTQLRQPGRPISEQVDLPRGVPTATMPRPDIESLLREDASADGLGPFRYGAVIETTQDLSHAGRWDVTDEGTFVWRLRVTSPGAHSLGIVFGAYDIPRGGQVFLYDDHRNQVLGAYTEANNKANGVLAIEPLAGDAVTIEYVQAAWVTETARLSVAEVVHDYLDLFRSDFWNTPGVAQGQCFVDVNCPEGAPYQDIKRSVVRALSGGGGCTAAIVNNTANDGTPYLLTVNHCSSFTNAVVVFNYELPGCTGGTAPATQTVSGATLLASSTVYDSQLYLLSSAPPPSYNPYYAGWYPRRGSEPRTRSFDRSPAGSAQEDLDRQLRRDRPGLALACYVGRRDAPLPELGQPALQRSRPGARSHVLCHQLRVRFADRPGRPVRRILER